MTGHAGTIAGKSNRPVMPEPVVGRFAPSPTGPLHSGSLVAAVGSYLMARRSGGRWLVRLDDLDGPRVVPGMADEILRTLDLLGLHWDGSVLRQSERGEIYRNALERLSAQGLVYPCGCSRSEIAGIASAPHGPGDELVYPGTCRDGLPVGKLPRAFRIRVGDVTVSFHDQVMGEVHQSLDVYSGDFVVRRADGPFSYHLATVVDDGECGITQVVRGADLLTSTPRQIFLMKMLGYAVPVYAHLPLVVNRDGSKLSKRDNALPLASAGELSEIAGALLLAAIRFLGQTPPAELEGAGPKEVLHWGVVAFDCSMIPRWPAPLALPIEAGP